MRQVILASQAGHRACAGLAGIALMALAGGLFAEPLFAAPPTSAPPSRAEFRPVPGHGRQAPVDSRRRRAAANTAFTAPRQAERPLFGRVGGRKAVPVTRGQELGLRFRPDERDPAYGVTGAGQPFPEATGNTADDATAFRPVPRKGRPTYEELQAETRREGADPYANPLPRPVMPYPPVMPPPGAGWPVW